jgi:hypothetical protein
LIEELARHQFLAIGTAFDERESAPAAFSPSAAGVTRRLNNNGCFSCLVGLRFALAHKHTTGTIRTGNDVEKEFSGVG